jgi:hypothetical protein
MRHATLAVLTFVLLGAALACGDSDEGSGGAAGTSAAEACLQTGMTEICKCDTGASGSRRCASDLFWTKCTCAPVITNERCMPGDPVTCPAPCPGETEVRTVECLSAGTFQCCPVGGGAGGSGGGADGGGMNGGGSGAAGTGAGNDDDAGANDDDAG